MFFKKKKPTALAQDEVARLFVEAAKQLYYDRGLPDGSSTVSAVLVFDNLQRVSHVENFVIDGLPKVPSFKVIESISKLFEPLQSWPPAHQLKSLTVAVKDGELHTQAEYNK